jgi:hypothetical protein
MGFIDTTPELPVLYNVVHAVGENCPNHRDDVMMIQYLLLNFYKTQPKEAAPNGIMTVDGICGRITKNWIRKFQMDLRRTTHSTYVDGRIDRIRNTQTLQGSISKTYYVLAWLDWYVSDLAPTEYAALPLFVPVSNPNNVPPPSNDVVKPPSPPKPVSQTGGA